MHKKNTLEINKLNLAFENSDNSKKLLFRNFSYSFNEDHIYTISGDNGAGKTTLFNLISGLLTNKSLKQKNLGLNLEFDKLHYNHETYDLTYVSYITQNFKNSFFNDTIKKEILFTINNCETDLTFQDIVDFYAYFEYDLKEFENESPFSLNYGKQKLLAFFLAIIKKHKILLLDEIDSAFSLTMKDKISNFIKNYYKQNLNREAIIIIISHDDSFIDKVSDIKIDFNSVINDWM